MSEREDRVLAHWSALQAQWGTSRSAWRDVVALRFEQEYWSEFETEMPKLLAALEDLEESLATARRESD
jgi:hypothetical protein